MKFACLMAATLCAILSAQQPQSWTSHDKIALSTYFYWYDVNTGAFMVSPGGNDILTIHPPAADLSTFSYKLISWHQQQLSDMAAAGIDVALPVYWGDSQSIATWSQPGLRNMVAAAQALVQSGMPVPKIGMFHDVTSAEIQNNGPVDLTTAAGKALFYSAIHDFFNIVPSKLRAMIDGKPIIVFYTTNGPTPSTPYISAWDQTIFDYITQHFQSDFGATPYFIRETSWSGVKTDAYYQWGAALDHPYFTGDVVDLGPGFNETNRSKYIDFDVPRIRDRDCGLFYQDGWDEVQLSNSRLAIIETWNEFIESTGVANTLEYGRQFISLSAARIQQWKATAPYTAPATLQINFGRDEFTSGLHPLWTNVGDGAWLSTYIAGREAASPQRNGIPIDLIPSYYLYLNVDDSYLHGTTTPVWVTVEYLDTGTAAWRLEYDGANGPYTPTQPVIMTNSGTWKIATFNLPDAQFQKRENASADLRIDDYNTSGESHYFSRVWIGKSVPGPTVSRVNPLSDLVIAPGSAMDLPLAALSSDGSPVNLTLARGPGYASIQTGASGSVLHLAPGAKDVQACPEVITVSAGAVNVPLADAASFRVLVANTPGLRLSVPAMAFTASQGAATPAAQVLSASTSSGGSFNWTAVAATQTGGNWLQVSPGGGNSLASAQLQATANPAGLAIGTYAGSITVTAPGLTNPTQTVPVSLTNTAAGSLKVSSPSLNFTTQLGQDPAAQTMNISNSGPAGSVLTWTASAATASGGNWLSITPGGGTNSGTIQVSIHVATLAAGSYTGTVSIIASGTVGTLPIAVTLIVKQSAVIQAMYDSWDYTSGIAPGAWVTISGNALTSGAPQTWNLSGVQQLPTTLGGVTVTFNGTPAPLYYVSATQINALVPASVVPGPAQAIVQSDGLSSSPFSIAASATLPAIYAPASADGSAFFVTAALQGTAFLVGNSAVDPRVVRAAQPGDILDLYMIGLGATTDPSKFVTSQTFSGAYPVSAPVTATVGGEAAPILFAGLTSPGLYLVRAAIPSDLPAGPQAIQISAGGSQTRSSLILAIGASPPNVVQNGSFESPIAAPWQFANDGSTGSAATVQRTTSMAYDSSYSAQIDVTTAAAHTSASSPCLDCAVQFWQTGLALQQSHVYMLQFWAKADTARTMRLALGASGPPFQSYGLSTTVALGGDWQRYVIYFQATATDPNGRLTFYFGDQAGNAWLDAVTLQ